MITIIVILAILLAISFIISVKLYKKDNTSKTIFRNIPFYTFLANEKVEVVYTNYYDLNKGATKTEPIILGNVLQCKNACDSGRCGTHEKCTSCVIRASIVKALTDNKPFNDLEAHLKLYNKHHEAVDADVSITGKPIMLNNQKHIIISVKDITTYKIIQRRFIENEYRLNNSIREKNIYLKLIEEISQDFEDKKGNIIDRIEKEKQAILKEELKKKEESQKEEETKPIISILPVIMIVTKEKKNFELYKDYLERKYQIIHASSAEEALTTYLYANTNAIIIEQDIDICESAVFTDAVKCSNGNQPIIMITNVGKKAVGTFDASIQIPLTQEKLERALDRLNV